MLRVLVDKSACVGNVSKLSRRAGIPFQWAMERHSASCAGQDPVIRRIAMCAECGVGPMPERFAEVAHAQWLRVALRNAGRKSELHESPHLPTLGCAYTSVTQRRSQSDARRCKDLLVPVRQTVQRKSSQPDSDVDQSLCAAFKSALNLRTWSAAHGRCVTTTAPVQSTGGLQLRAALGPAQRATTTAIKTRTARRLPSSAPRRYTARARIVAGARKLSPDQGLRDTARCARAKAVRPR